MTNLQLWIVALAVGLSPSLAHAGKGNPSMPQPDQHRPFFLRNAKGEIIDPIAGLRASEPYSPAQTCGASKCHDYKQIVAGYHFQQGAERLGAKNDPLRPWVLSNGMFGGHRPAALRQLAKKSNAHPDEIDVTVWEWVTRGSAIEPSCAACHPGGGPLERDRDGKRYDLTLAANPKLAQSLDGDYRGALWHKSGVLEADCLLCHSPAYDWKERNRQLLQGNLQWAATVASGLGAVAGAVLGPDGKETGKTPTVSYNKRLFNEDGRVVPPMQKSPIDRNCINCHGAPDEQKRGFTWNDAANPDVHQQQGLRCVSCHVAGLDHNFARGRPTVEEVRPDLRGTIRGCADCHLVGYGGATVPAHAALPPSHLKNISCKTCHIPSLGRAAAKFFDTTRGDVQWDVIGNATRVGEPKRWSPAYQNVDGKIAPVNPMFGVWWGNRDIDGIVHPLFARELRAGWKLFAKEVHDDNGDGVPEVNRPAEITAGLKAFAESLAGNRRFRGVHPVYVKAGTLYELEGGALKSSAYAAGNGKGFSVSHNVAPAKEALGAGGCGDCHARDGKLFSRSIVVDPFDAQGNEVREPAYKSLGMSDFSYTMFSVYWSLARPWIGVAIGLLFFVLMLHFTRFGPHDFGGKPLQPRPDDNDRISRFTFFERMLHLTVLVTCLFLAVTGLAFTFNGWRWLHLLFGDSITPRIWHGWLGYVFGVGVVVMLFRWWRDAVPVKADLAWVKEYGGYLGSHKPVPAGRFNAGQKMYFWMVILGGGLLFATGIVLYFAEYLPLDWVFLAAAVHNLAGIFGVAGVLSHIYLSTAANPGTVQAIFAGWVTKGWARMHHPLWYEKVTKTPALDAEKKEEPKAGK